MSKIIGIDLGTSNSAAAVLEGGEPKMVKSTEGTSLYGKTFPSVVAFTDDGELLVGQPAKRQAVTNPERTLEKVKRDMGTETTYEINGDEYTPQQISGFILQKIKRDAEEFLNEDIDKAVITVPAYFDDNQRQATKDAGKIAGLEVERLVNEPTAASLAYGLDKEDEHREILVFDVGAGTFDVTVMDMDEGVFEVQSTAGDTELGGKDMDDVLVDHITEEFEQETGIDLTEDEQAMQRVYEAAEEAKIELSSTVQTEINLPFIAEDDNGDSKNLQMTLQRSKLEELVQPILDRMEAPVQDALDNADMTASDVDNIILVGGPTRMPAVQDWVEDRLGTEPERGIDPMECVSKGAAIQGGVLSGEVKDVLLLDVTPLSLGIETEGGVFTRIIEKNTTIPTEKSRIFSTAQDNQRAVTIKVYQGEREMAEDNELLGEFDLVGIPPAPRGVPQIEVTFDIDADGIVHVSAEDKGTGKEQSIKITAPQKLDDEEIEQMKQEAEEHAEEDERRKERVQTLNEARGLINNVEEMLDEMDEQLESEQTEEIEALVDDLESLLDEEEPDVDEVQDAMDELNDAVQDVSSQMYQQAAQQAEGAQGQAQGMGQMGPGAQMDKNPEDVEEADTVDDER